MSLSWAYVFSEVVVKYYFYIIFTNNKSQILVKITLYLTPQFTWIFNHLREADRKNTYTYMCCQNN